MRSKALLVAARAGFVGPTVTLEEGEWLVEPPEGVGVFEYGAQILSKKTVEGPTKVYARVFEDYSGPDVNLSIEQISRA